MAGDTTRERILQVAGPLFAERGFEEVTVREICERAGANVAAVNYYFGSKERLYVETLAQVCASRPDEQIVRQWPPGTPAAEKLWHFVRSVLQHLLAGSAQSWEVQLMMREIIKPTEAGREFLRDHFRRGFDHHYVRTRKLGQPVRISGDRKGFCRFPLRAQKLTCTR